MDYKEEQNGEIEALLSIYEGEIEGKLELSFKQCFTEGRSFNSIF